MNQAGYALSIKRSRIRTGNICVSSSPSKIPYGGFSPVRLQTGIPPRPSRPLPDQAFTFELSSHGSPH